MQVGVAIATVQLECETTDAKKEKRNTKQELDLNGVKVQVLALCWQCLGTCGYSVFDMTEPPAGVQHQKAQGKETLNPAIVFL